MHDNLIIIYRDACLACFEESSCACAEHACMHAHADDLKHADLQIINHKNKHPCTLERSWHIACHPSYHPTYIPLLYSYVAILTISYSNCITELLNFD